jgi:ribulose 1,5-bisphosphate synthetase/thiazole synthase
MKAPKLTCVISGQSRVTSENYLRQKADRLGKSVEWLLNNYVSKNVCSKLRKGVAVSKITDTVFSDSQLADLVRNNSKCREEFSFVDGVYTPAKAKAVTKTPKAPKVVAVKKETTLEEAVTTAVNNVPGVKYEWDSEKETTVLKTSTEVLDEMVNNKNPF